MAVVANVAINVDASKALTGLKGVNTAVERLSVGVDKAAKGQKTFSASVANTEVALKRQIEDLRKTRESLDINSKAYKLLTSDIDFYEKKLRSAGTSTNAFQKAITGLGSGISKVGQAMTSLAGIAASIGAGAAVSGFVKAGVESERTTKKIAALSGQYEETAQLNAVAAKAADEFGIGQTRAAQAVSDLYGRLRPMGVSLKDIDTTFTGVNKAAALMNLTTADTEGVMLQLSQAMGSGKLQGDELRSVMERLPAVGQAVAKVMGVSVGEIKELGAQGKITTDVIIKAMAELNKIQPPPPDPYKLFQKAIEDLNTAIGTQLLPVFTPLIQKLTELVGKFQELGVGASVAQALVPIGDVLLQLLEGFMRLDPGMQQFIIQFGAIAGAISLVIVPLGLIVSSIGALTTAVGSVIGALQGMTILSTVAGWLGALVPALTAVVAVLTGPAGIVIAIGAGIAAGVLFGDEIRAALESVGQYFSDMLGGIQFVFQELGKIFSGSVDTANSIFVQPIVDLFNSAVDGISNAFAAVQDAITAPFDAAVGIVRGIMNNLLTLVENTINSVIQAVNRLIQNVNNISSKVGIPAIPFVQEVGLPRFAAGGYVDGATQAIVGESGPEYIIPASKMNEAMARYASGQRGSSVIPNAATSEAGSYSAGASSINPVVNVTTGPVMNMNNSNYVSQADFLAGLQAASRQGAQMALATLQNNSSTRRAVGIR